MRGRGEKEGMGEREGRGTNTREDEREGGRDRERGGERRVYMLRGSFALGTDEVREDRDDREQEEALEYELISGVLPN